METLIQIQGHQHCPFHLMMKQWWSLWSMYILSHCRNVAYASERWIVSVLQAQQGLHSDSESNNTTPQCKTRDKETPRKRLPKELVVRTLYTYIMLGLTYLWSPLQTMVLDAVKHLKQCLSDPLQWNTSMRYNVLIDICDTHAFNLTFILQFCWKWEWESHQWGCDNGLKWPCHGPK